EPPRDPRRRRGPAAGGLIHPHGPTAGACRRGQSDGPGVWVMRRPRGRGPLTAGGGRQKGCPMYGEEPRDVTPEPAEASPAPDAGWGPCEACGAPADFKLLLDETER